jgi:hypothetical protein
MASLCIRRRMEPPLPGRPITLLGSLNPPCTLSIENIASGSAGTLSTTTLTNLLSSVLFGSSGGYVVYGQGGQLYDWITAGGSVLYSMQPPARCISLARRFTSRMAHRRRLCGTDALADATQRSLDDGGTHTSTSRSARATGRQAREYPKTEERPE